MSSELEEPAADVLVIGGGFAGTLAAIKARQHGAPDVVLIDKSGFGRGGPSAFCSGVLAAPIPQEDDIESWMQLAVRQSEYLIDQEWLRISLLETYDRLKELDKWGMENLGRYVLEKTRKGTFERIPCRAGVQCVMFQGGSLVMDVLRKECERRSIRVLDRVMITAILADNSRAFGAAGFDVRSGDFKVFQAGAIVIAAGGNRYKMIKPGTRVVTGDSHAMAFRVGAELINYDVQCAHECLVPSPLFEGSGAMNMFFGQGAKYVNKHGEPFMSEYDSACEDAATLSTLTGAMAMEVELGNGPIYLDATHFSPTQVEKVRKMDPIAAKCLEAVGVIVGDKIDRKIEAKAAAPGTIACGGGIRVNTKCETSIRGLYAAGDAAGVRVIGGGALGGGPFALVSGARAGTFAAKHARRVAKKPRTEIVTNKADAVRKLTYEPLRCKEGMDPEYIFRMLLESFVPYRICLIRRQERLQKALKGIRELRDLASRISVSDYHNLMFSHEVKNMVLCAELALHCWLERKESRSFHLRDDYRNMDNVHWLKWIIAKKRRNGEIQLTTEAIPFERYPHKPDRKIIKHPLWAIAEGRRKVGHSKD